MSDNSVHPVAGPLFREPRFDALRNALYHTERSNFLNRLNRCLNFFVIVFGAGVVGKATERFSISGVWLEFGVVIFATAQLVFDLGGQARNHEFLQRRYYELLAEMELEPSPGEKVINKWSARLLTLSGEEPMAMRALDAVAYNKALDAIYDDPQTQERYRQKVGWRYYLRNYLAFNGHKFHSR